MPGWSGFRPDEEFVVDIDGCVLVEKLNIVWMRYIFCRYKWETTDDIKNTNVAIECERGFTIFIPSISETHNGIYPGSTVFRYNVS
jgi:hypothetical protein